MNKYLAIVKELIGEIENLSIDAVHTNSLSKLAFGNGKIINVHFLKKSFYSKTENIDRIFNT